MGVYDICIQFPTLFFPADFLLGACLLMGEDLVTRHSLPEAIPSFFQSLYKWKR